MTKSTPMLLAVLFCASAHAQTQPSAATAPACKKSSGINVFIEVDARPAAFSHDTQSDVHVSPTRSLDLIAQFESKLNDRGFCVLHNDEFDSTGNISRGVASGNTSHVDVAFLATVQSMPDAREFLVYSVHFGDWTTTPRLPYFILNEKSDITALAQKLSDTLKDLVTP